MNEEKKELTLEEKIEQYELMLREQDAQLQLKSRAGELSRARSYSIGNTAGGCVELTLRGIDSKILWYMLQPAEVSEVIHTLAASIGCYAALKPREDFASWRNWALKPDERVRLFNDPDSMHEISTRGRIGLEHNEIGKPINNNELSTTQKIEE